MLMMKCPQCQQTIRSALLAELKVIDCDHCLAEVPVTNVLVSYNGFTFERTDLLKRFYRYRKLLDEVIEERNKLKSDSGTSDASLRSVEKFMSVLQGMMAGARDHFRCDFVPPVPVKLSYLQQECLGTISNLSMDGACIEMSSNNPLPRVKGAISLSFNLPEQKYINVVSGEVCWARKGDGEKRRTHSSGVRFTGLDDTTRDVLWDYISAAARQKAIAET